MTGSGEISGARAIEIARLAVEGRAELTTPSNVEVERRGGVFIVTFPRCNPPGVRAADYDARVTIAARTGEVVEILAAS